MDIFSIFRKKEPEIKKEPEASTVNYSNLQVEYFDGEKTPFELGSPLDWEIDYYSLRARAWEAYLQTDIILNAIRKYVLWIVGPGLKIQSEPVTELLKTKGINLSDKEVKEFTESVETQFRLFCNTRQSTYTTNECLHDLACEALKNALLAGDCLVINRYARKTTNTQLIDGGLIETPIDGCYSDAAAARGNVIIKGVEVNEKGTHIAYYISNDDYASTRIEARLKDGTIQAWLMYGLRGKLSDVRGVSLLVAVLETVSKMDRYKDASVGSAEENAKTVATIEHDALSDGDNPMMAQMKAVYSNQDGGVNQAALSGEAVAGKIAMSENKRVYNLGPGQKYVQNNPNSDSNFGSFYGINLDVVYSTLGIPPEVAMDKFGGAYSGSRAALKSWEYKMFTDRSVTLDRGFYGPIFNFWIYASVLNQKLKVRGYEEALHKRDFMVLAAYHNHRFIGATVPHIDPVKEANAERVILGPAYKDVPLTTADQSMENLNRGDFPATIKKATNEKEIAKEFIIEPIIDNNKLNE